MLREKTYQIIKNSPPQMKWEVYEKRVRDKWNELLSSEANEPTIHEFLEKHPSLLPGAFGLTGRSGHNPFPCAVITKPPLQSIGKKIPDFLWIATDSKSVYPILIEL